MASLASSSSPASSSVVVGIDGGGTSTKAVVVAPTSGAVVGRATTGSSNTNSVGDAAACANILLAIDQALEQAQASRADVARVCLCLSGVDRPEDLARVRRWMEPLHGADPSRVAVFNDAVAALASGTKGKLDGIVVISGTGMIGYGRHGDRKPARSAGWGPLLGDTGSGYAIGEAVLKAACQSNDGRGPSSALEARVQAHLKLSKFEDVIAWAYETPNEWAKIAALAPLAFEAAAEGDAVADGIIATAVEDLVACAASVARQLSMDAEGTKFPLVLSGSVLLSSGMKARATKAFQEALPGAVVQEPGVDAAHAAALIATCEEYFRA